MLHEIKMRLRLKKYDNILIHIGKCGGSSLRNALSQSKKIKNTGIIHITKPVYLNTKYYYIVARDPVLRCISAFNWRYKLVVIDQSQKNRFKNEYNILLKYKSLNNIAEKLYDKLGTLDVEVASEFENIHHLQERISFYLKSFLQACHPGNIKGVFMQESLNSDIEYHLGVSTQNIVKEKLNSQTEGSYLSPLGKRNLVRYIQEDYNCLFILYNLGHIKKEAMRNIYNSALSNPPAN